MAALERRGKFPVTLLAPPQDSGKAGRRGSQLRLALWQALRLYRVRPDVLHVHEHPSLLVAAVAYQVFRGQSVGIIYTSHIDPVERRVWWKRAIIGWLFSRCDRITVMAHQSIRKLELVASPVPEPSRVEVVPAAASDVRVRDKHDPEVIAFGASIGCRHDGPVLLQVSNCVYPAKVAGTVRLMEAFVDVRRRWPHARLIVLGRGPLLETVMQARERLGLTASVIVPGAFIEDLSLPMGLADLHCHISLQDMCPISVLEAMHAGKPLIASRAGGIPELIEDGVSGVLVDDDPQRIAVAIIDLLEHPARAAAIGAGARRAALARFTWDRVAADCERLYAVAGRRAARAARTQVVDAVH